MLNKAMEDMLAKGEAIDVSEFDTVEFGTMGLVYVIPSEHEDTIVNGNVELCNAKTETFLWSVGKEVNTGRILGAHDSRFYGHPSYECIWLR